MHLAAQIADIEQRLRTRKVALSIVLDEAKIDRSTWTRWRAGTTRPRLDTWLAAQAAAEKILLDRAGA